jgi:hypothetical protein
VAACHVDGVQAPAGTAQTAERGKLQRRKGEKLTEAGGPTTQSGIYYQNTVAARYLAALLDLRLPSPAGASRVLSVRVEAPAHIDDTVVTFANGCTLFIQAKEALETSGEAWNKFWAATARQAIDSPSEQDEFRLVIGDASPSLRHLKEALERTQGKEDILEWMNALSKPQSRLARAVLAALAEGDQRGFAIAKRVRVEFLTLQDAETIGIRDWTPRSSKTSTALFSHLRDLCGGRARTRHVFRAAELSETLLKKFDTRVYGTAGDELERYRDAMASSLDHISVPGTALSAAEADLFVWPHIHALDRESRSDFEDEEGRVFGPGRLGKIDLSQFPAPELGLAVLESGAGYGKSTILRATARRIISSTSRVAAVFHAEHASRHASLLEYLDKDYNAEYGLQIDWIGLCEQGRTVFVVDGIDEIDDSARSRLIEMISKSIARFPEAAFLIGARDSSIAQLPSKFKLLRVQRLDDDQIRISRSRCQPCKSIWRAAHWPIPAKFDPSTFRNSSTDDPGLSPSSSPSRSWKTRTIRCATCSSNRTMSFTPRFASLHAASSTARASGLV